MEIPDWIQTTDDREVFREFVYPAGLLRSGEVSIFYNRAILSPRNDSVESFNDNIAELRTADSREYHSLDTVGGTFEGGSSKH